MLHRIAGSYKENAGRPNREDACEGARTSPESIALPITNSPFRPNQPPLTSSNFYGNCGTKKERNYVQWCRGSLRRPAVFSEGPLFRMNLKNFQYSWLSTPKMPSKPKTKRKEVPETKRAAIITWRKAGKSYSQISLLEATPYSTVVSIIRRAELRPKNPIRSQKRTGRPPKVTERGARSLCRIAEAENKLDLFELSTPSKSGKSLHRQTTSKILATRGLFRRRARTKPYLSPKHQAERYKWCKERENWSIEQWRSVIWTDESTFEVGKDSRVIWVT